jgi:type VI secretion system protein ImpM
VPGAAIDPVRPVAMGFFGKIPARGDFVRGGLPRAFVEPWDSWLQHVLSDSRERLGARWLPAWMEAPIWHFVLPAGQCGSAPVLGVWMPSIDSAGRHFPLTLARVGALPQRPGEWLAAAEAVGLATLQLDLGPEEMALRLESPGPVPDNGEPEMPGDDIAYWWTEGSPFVPRARLALAGLPDGAIFAAMLQAVPESEVQPVGPPGPEGARE